ncbi:ATP-binding cassette domain-containing protein [Pedobacter sp. HMF7647]|uniref:ATP-binding cassette domain-containing protein n=1 Tax=Hufsiella arboris TaxID=2695275 RepID=A0A7K1Y7E3_9SPHI|nr:ATP-binding cassette domain-containing protein [Hufsiella arboris]MXV50492.1 ATP-binding cassette domain-containing protein [Hufsiella arboris]
MIKLTSVGKDFNKGKANHVQALSDINFEVNEKQFVVILGANGSGKSTLLNLISGNLFPSSGTIYFDNTEVTRLPDFQRSRWIARVFQNPLSGTAPDLTILDNFRLAALRSKSKKLSIGATDSFKKLVQEKISTLGMGLEDKVYQPVGSLSGGQRQAVTLLMSTMDETRILLLDEPTAALDPRSAALVMQTANRIISENNLTAVMVTHNLKDAYNYGNRVVQLAEGKIIRDLNTEEKAALNEADLFHWFT